MNLPPFPVDPDTLDLIERAMSPDPDLDETTTSLAAVLDLLSEMGGSDPSAADVIDEGDELLGRPQIVVHRDPFYSHHDLILALIAEVRRLRKT